MKCPNCGNEMEEGHLICEVCGNEIRIVPDFEPEIENSITETLSTLAALQEEEAAGKKAEAVREPDGKQEDTEIKEDAGKEKIYDAKEKKRIYERSRRAGVLIAAGIILLIALSFWTFYSYRIQTVSYQVDKARECAARGDYREAVRYLDNAYEKDDTQAQILFLKADYFYLMADNESALQALWQVIDRGIYSYEDVEEAYDKIIAIYTQEERYEEINELLLSCKEDSIVSMFQSYMAMEPEFSYIEGDYAEVIPLKLSSNTSGTIYYTTDGSTPDENSQVYTAPLFLENGDHTISALFVNDYGIRSEVVSKSYHINLEVPDAPEVELYSGIYTQPMMISVNGQEGCSTFYTTDDSQPTKDSVPYSGPIPMPLGTTNFKFVNVSGDGVYSDVTMRTYTLRLWNTLTTDEAVARLIDRLVETHYLLNAGGKTELQSGTLSYQFSSVLQIGEDVYFTINEYYDDGTGLMSRTDKVFLIQAYTGAAARLGYDENGEFAAVPI
ncbi:MAG: chitobiase/beta-hexosaminidase C-terminal domain-containing protein [Blautia sp.]|nr:chitobiase/beta-hexosaminidase C-terminal domain-containing protein [Blautia sp.]MCM1200467.1 chitobiase/beta-hexosaminidase C-terminal domain-containing protein [Bacteroides fragilis]